MQSKKPPAISVVLPVYNTEKYIMSAVDSILAQTFEDFELIIINDGSTDSTDAILDGYDDRRLILIRQKNMGLAKSLNKAINIASSNLIARMDADDLSHPDRLKLQFDYMRKNPNCVALGTNAIFMDKDGAFLYKSKCVENSSDIKKILPRSPFFHSATMFRKDIFLKVGGYFEKIPQFGEDAILWNKMNKFGDLNNLPDFLIKYRIVPSSITAQKFNYPGIDAVVSKICRGEKIDENEIEMILRSKSSASKKLIESNYYLRIGKIHIEYNFNRKIAIKNIIKSISLNPLNGVAWFNIILIVLPFWVIRLWKNYRGVYSNVW